MRGLIIAITFLFGCSALAAENVYRRILAKPLINLSPHKLEDEYSLHIMNQCLLGLLTIGEDTHVESALASEWSLSRDKTVYTFKLRPGLKYSDGTDLHAADFVRSIESVLKKDSVLKKEMSVILGAETFSRGKSKTVKGLTIIDPLTIQIKLVRPFPPFLLLLASPPFGVLRGPDIKNLREKKIAKFASLGPYYIHELGEKILILKKNPHYYKANSIYFDELQYDLLVPEDEAVKGFAEGKYFDIYPFVVPDAVAEKANAQKITTFTAMSQYLQFNLNKPIVKHLRIRQLIFKHFDFNTFLKLSGRSERFRAYGVIPRGMLGFKDHRELSEPPNEKKALAEAKCTEAKPCKLVIEHPYMEYHAPLLAGVKTINERFKELQIDVQLQERLKWYRKFISGDYALVAVGNSAIYPDTLLYLKYLADPNYHPGLNRTEILKILDRSLKTDNTELRRDLFEKADDVLFEQMGIIPLFHGDQPYRWISGKLEPFSSPLTGFNRIRIDRLKEREKEKKK